MDTRAVYPADELDVDATFPAITTKSTEEGTYDNGKVEQYTEPAADSETFITITDFEGWKVTS